ncbi:MAG: lipopolysaccharide kinase InaA family protein [Candidatus Polarisedimenticolaceae bacterium]|nr:lipopolysaccharide kinase InaA family protein [Candidatus Polarisedimenticolaceae bacterium]
MKLISGDEYQVLAQDAEVLECDTFGDKVLRRKDDQIIKLFRIKRLLSLSFFYPYSVRFFRNARRLNSLGVPSVQVEQVFYCPSIRRHGVVYPLLPGETLSHLLEKSQDRRPLMRQLAVFIAELHRKKIYFRSLHLGNILRRLDGRLGLIDVADLRFNRFPLTLWQRQRNFRHLLRRVEHRTLFEQFGMERFIGYYLDATDIPQQKRAVFCSLIYRLKNNHGR